MTKHIYHKSKPTLLYVWWKKRNKYNNVYIFQYYSGGLPDEKQAKVIRSIPLRQNYHYLTEYKLTTWKTQENSLKPTKSNNWA